MLNDARFQIYLAAWVLSSLAGLACQFRTKRVTWKGCFSASLNSGLCGLAVTLVGLTTIATKYPEAMLGMAVITGLGGMKTIEFVEEVGRESIAAFLHSAANKMIGDKTGRKDEDENEHRHVD